VISTNRLLSKKKKKKHQLSEVRGKQLLPRVSSSLQPSYFPSHDKEQGVAVNHRRRGKEFAHNGGGFSGNSRRIRSSGSSSSISNSRIAGGYNNQPLQRNVRALAKSSSNMPSALEKGLAMISYIVPLMDGLRYAKFLLRDFPSFAAIFVPLTPVIKFYYSFPYASLIFFFILYLAIAQNRELSRFVRFNGMQAVLLDVILNVPALAERFLLPNAVFSSDLGVWSYVQVYNTIFLYVFCSVGYGAISSLRGKAGKIPLVGNAADASASNY